MQITVYTTPSHAWGKAPISLLWELGIYNQITEYSYMLDEDAYLEEDCDLSLLYKTLEKSNIEYSINRVYIDSFNKDFTFLNKLTKEEYQDILNKKEALKKYLQKTYKKDGYSLNSYKDKFKLRSWDPTDLKYRDFLYNKYVKK